MKIKTMFFFMFFCLLLISGVGFYLYFRLRPLLPEPGTWQNIVAKCLFVLAMLSFFIGFGLQSKGFYGISTPFSIVGAWTLAAIMYLFLVFMTIDFARLLNCLIFKAECLKFHYHYGDSRGFWFSLVGSTIVALVLICGYFNAKFPVTKRITYHTDKAISRDFKYILISDVHLGIIHCDSFMEILCDRINSEQPDFVVIAGDFLDGDPNPVINSRVGDILRTVDTGYGIFACTGNHEWIGDVEKATEFLRRHGVAVLRDSLVNLPFGVSIIGRDDLMRNHRIDKRKPLTDIVALSPPNNYKIVLDHQPAHLEEAEKAGVDIQLSGHTHGGAQLWPMFLITRKLFENEFGKYRKGNTDFYTSSGYGTWGPPIRTSSRPEMVVVEVVKKIR